MEFSTATNLVQNSADQLGKVGKKLTKAKKTRMASSVSGVINFE